MCKEIIEPEDSRQFHFNFNLNCCLNLEIELVKNGVKIDKKEHDKKCKITKKL